MVIIGDIHGCYKTFLALLAQIPKNQQITLVGDLIDRGPASRQVVQHVMDHNIDCVMGNHEDMMIRWSGSLDMHNIWLCNGGDKTLDSYQDEHGNVDYSLFKKHQEWMADLPLMLSYPEIQNADGRHLVVSHSSCGKVWHWNEERRQNQTEHFEEIVLWGRNVPKDAPEIYNVFGHTIQQDGPRIKSFYSNVDTGCFKIWDAKCGVLTALQFPEMVVYTQKNLDIDPVQSEDE